MQKYRKFWQKWANFVFKKVILALIDSISFDNKQLRNDLKIVEEKHSPQLSIKLR